MSIRVMSDKNRFISGCLFIVIFFSVISANSVLATEHSKLGGKGKKVHVQFAVGSGYFSAVRNTKSFFQDNGFQIKPVHEWTNISTGELRRRYPTGWILNPNLFFQLDYKVGKSLSIGFAVQQLYIGEVTAFTKFDTVSVETSALPIQTWRVFIKEKASIKSYYFHMGFRQFFEHPLLKQWDYNIGLGISLNNLDVKLHSITAFNDTLSFRKMRFGGHLFAGVNYYFYSYVSIGLIFRANLLPSEMIRSFGWTDARSFRLPEHKAKFSGVFFGLVLGYHL